MNLGPLENLSAGVALFVGVVAVALLGGVVWVLVRRLRRTRGRTRPPTSP